MTDKNAKNENSKIRIMTFFPPFIILVAFLVLSLVDQETFLGVINNINNWIIKNLGWAASIPPLLPCFPNLAMYESAVRTPNQN